MLWLTNKIEELLRQTLKLSDHLKNIFVAVELLEIDSNFVV